MAGEKVGSETVGTGWRGEVEASSSMRERAAARASEEGSGSISGIKRLIGFCVGGRKGWAYRGGTRGMLVG